MEAYDAAVLSYAIASAAFKDRSSSFIGMSSLPHRVIDDSLTPPRDGENDVDSRGYLYQLLYNLEQMLMNRAMVQLSHLMEICSTKQSQSDIQISAPLDALLSELRQICKSNPGSIHLMQLQYEEESIQGVSLNTEIVCKTLADLFRLFGMLKGASLMKKICC